MEVVIENTNIAICHFCVQLQEIIENCDKYMYCNYIDITKLKSFIRILNLCGCLKQNLFNSHTMWYHKSANDTFAATMGPKRFSFICCFLQFNDKATHDERWKTDKFPCIRFFLRKSTETVPVVAFQVHIWQLMKPCNPTVGTYHSNSIIHLNLRSMAFCTNLFATL